ncbi:MAG TPA: SgcJ/EcaC family oxidoreductase [Spirosoma sp.]|jgi:uncharacterized protein (TIGR02246 family)|nr:SgcJ/EcaC family oxidoreductase [Spirosoma sp.]
MKKIICLGLLMVSINVTFGQQKATPADEQGVRKTIDAMMKSWSNHNYNDIATWTTPDVNWVNIVGMRWKGRDEVRIAHQAFHDTMFKNTPWTIKNVDIRFITPDVAVAHLLSHIGAFYPPDGIDHGGNKRPEADDMATLVFVKQQGNWLLTAGENVVVDAEAARNNPVSAKR